MPEKINLIEGEKYVLDKKYNNASTVTLVWAGQITCVVRADNGAEWQTMRNRLSEIEKE